MGSRLGSLFIVLRTNPPKPPECLVLENLQTLHIPTNKKLEVWTQYRLLRSFLGDYFSSFKNILRQREICKISGNQEKNHEKSQAVFYWEFG